MIFRCLSTGSWKKFWGQRCGFTQRTSFLTSIRSLQNYTISRLLQACYLCTSIRKLITKTCWINLVLYLLFFTATKELKQPSRVIIRQRSKLCMQKRTIKKSTTTFLLHTDWYCQGALKQTLEWWILITRKPNQNLTAYNRLPVNYAIRQYE